jgi:hypothetical protein
LKKPNDIAIFRKACEIGRLGDPNGPFFPAVRRGVTSGGESQIDFSQVFGYIAGAGKEPSPHTVTI